MNGFRTLLAGDAEAKEENYMARGPYTEPLTAHQSLKLQRQSEPRFRALLTDGGARVFFYRDGLDRPAKTLA